MTTWEKYPKQSWDQLGICNDLQIHTLLNGLLDFNPKTRWSTNQVLSHPFFNAVHMQSRQSVQQQKIQKNTKLTSHVNNYDSMFYNYKTDDNYYLDIVWQHILLFQPLTIQQYKKWVFTNSLHIRKKNLVFVCNMHLRYIN